MTSLENNFSMQESLLQKLLVNLLRFCQKWNLKVNDNKAKLIYFSFLYDGQGIEIVGEYKYLGIIFKPSGTFSEAINYLCKKASKALFCIRKAVTYEDLNVNF